MWWSLQYRLTELGRRHGLAMALLAVALVFGTLAVRATQSKIEAQEIHCLALNIYHEARGEPALGQAAVALVTLNRVRSGGFPDNVCAVVFQRRWLQGQQRYAAAFSWTVDHLGDAPVDEGAWRRSLDTAHRLYLAKEPPPPLDQALYYHATSVTPAWSRQRPFIKRIGGHLFYR